MNGDAESAVTVKPMLGWNVQEMSARVPVSAMAGRKSACVRAIAALLLLISFVAGAQDSDLQQFLRGDRFTYSSEGNQKSNGLKITFDYPRSWNGIDGKRPNTLFQVTSKNGRGLELCNLLIKSLPLPDDYQPTKEEILELFSTTGVRDFVPDGAVFVSSDRTAIEALPGAWIIYEYDLDRAGIKIKMKAIVYVIYFDANLIQLGCMVGDTPEISKSKRDLHFNAYHPLFQQIANSIVVHNRWPR